MAFDPAELSVRAYNILRREGINTIGQLVALTYSDLDKMRGMNARTAVDIDSYQKHLVELLDRDTREILANFLDDLIGPQGIEGSKQALEIADRLLENFEIEEK